jgi:8-oxo-dGTP pyrophosphatase MutT (NUDIX family)
METSTMITDSSLMSHYKDVFKNYIPHLEQEVTDQKLILDHITTFDNALSRENLIAHVTSSVMILNQNKTKVLLGFHHIYQSWGWFGGHNDDDPDCLHVALKEATEETGLQTFLEVMKEPISLDVVYVGNHIKKGKYIPDHLHLNITYGLRADDTLPLLHNEEEHLGLKWFELHDYLNHITEPRMVPIYQKIISRML